MVGSDAWVDAPAIGVAETSDPTPNTGYGTETGESGYPTRTAWWSFTPSTAGWIRLDTRASTYADGTPGPATYIGVYTGTSVGALTLVAERDVFDGDDYVLIKLEATAGTQYWVKIGSVWDEALTYVLTVSDYAVTGDWIYDPDNVATYGYSGEFFPHADGPEFGPARPGWDSQLVSEDTTTAEDAWASTYAGAGTVTPASEAWSEKNADNSVPGIFTTLWSQGWSTLHRATGPTVTTGLAPYQVDDETDVATLEWEPTSTAISAQVIGTFQNTQGSDTGYVQIKVAQVSDTEASAPVEVAFYSGSEAAALPTVATVSGLTTPSFTELAFAGDVADLPLSGPATVVLGILDSYTVEQAPVFAHVQQMLTSAQIRGVYAPRYRELRWDTVPPTPPVATRLRAPSLRQLHRGGPGGIGGIPRAVSNPTRQASPRRGPGTVL